MTENNIFNSKYSIIDYEMSLNLDDYSDNPYNNIFNLSSILDVIVKFFNC